MPVVYHDHARTLTSRTRARGRHRGLAKVSAKRFHSKLTARRTSSDHHRAPATMLRSGGRSHHRALRRHRRVRRSSDRLTPNLGNELAERNISILWQQRGFTHLRPVMAALDRANRIEGGAQRQCHYDQPWRCCRVIGQGNLISGSAAGNSPIPNNATYAASKAFAPTARIAARR